MANFHIIKVSVLRSFNTQLNDWNDQQLGPLFKTLYEDFIKVFCKEIKAGTDDLDSKTMSVKLTDIHHWDGKNKHVARIQLIYDNISRDMYDILTLCRVDIFPSENLVLYHKIHDRFIEYMKDQVQNLLKQNIEKAKTNLKLARNSNLILPEVTDKYFEAVTS